MGGPLQGIRVVEIGTLIAAPFAARLMAEFGADVVKIEAPQTGDPLRKWRKLHEGTSLWWYLQSRNKKSVCVNLKSPEGVEIVKRLAAEADVVIENLRPGALEKLGIGWDVLHAINPKLTMVRISGYGQSGPYRDRPGFGAIGEAMGGIRYTTGEVDGAPARVGVSLGDSLASLHGVIGALMSLLRVKTGQGDGQVVDVSLVESVFNLMESLVPEYDLLGHVRERSGGALPGIAPSNTYPTEDDGYVVIAGNSDPIFRRLMQVIGRADLADDPALAHNDGRAKHCAMLDEAIAAWTSHHSTDDVLAALERAEVPAGRIYSVADIVADPHYQARDMLLQAQLPGGASVKMPGIVPKLSETPGEVRWQGPALGEHTGSVLSELGFASEEIERLRREGAVQ
ncbi:crotonobetainyl-CoA:carnitine CoA-transferase CaiB-like acyl-CoA transferase [Paraburkholderia sp. GV068]|jgi:crotonobetainyl-CoA:carnitine CoA-transferase CaiB-like acyl-CoA transferase|uniref:L-carnitine dehydratase/bile acid-inducible protein F n=1 Tax=Paraburkholderia graminis (strain ATCC 700544 / DSM 17151 / LMG 18924 / NCIMB 13744 / C4D1M) TaxID=396598 RepID=B1FVC2_PARG4|nr:MULTISPECIES: CaiB/BaiF CoA-transferase family protein [Paraburkholderia]EDT12354.1 L-carnitine dehydratase/bile acid-inducible protein F [Paraburkholderia graminis C4D1M]MDR6476754.1 crotonobetainyl-CoA:carnitine CoA-transferase CaiB-like acyl-CoA transferase [Paraburkholderia graminis]PTR03447.1 crotonobetainyl-CoA:carnitine CoA-transferase CaiB-like acyl-CoA transferase [Paraburkholderia sp. GV072]PUB08149.1 crotonobetainyl-CoA:carnitine CoA-transferase CaiB-like acyl-CoA transferase [Par